MECNKIEMDNKWAAARKCMACPLHVFTSNKAVLKSRYEYDTYRRQNASFCQAHVDKHLARQLIHFHTVQYYYHAKRLLNRTYCLIALALLNCVLSFSQRRSTAVHILHSCQPIDYSGRCCNLMWPSFDRHRSTCHQGETKLLFGVRPYDTLTLAVTLHGATVGIRVGVDSSSSGQSE